jgi:hypothetical protein
MTNRYGGALLLTLAAALSGCQARTAGEDKSQVLERRVQELERQLAAPPAAQAAASQESADALPRAQPPAPPRPERWVLPEGTELTLRLETPLFSATSREGDPVVARVERAAGPEGKVLLPGGTVVRGRVTEAVGSGRVSGRARVTVDFDRLVVRGRSHELEGARISAEARSEGGRDAKMVGGGSAAGAILGALVDGKKGLVRGALIGAAAGGGAALATKGREIELPAGSRWKVRIRETVRL